jgi:hypothetical protein
MSHFWKVALSILFLFCFITTARADLDFFSRIYLSDKKYANHIIVKTYLVTIDQLSEYFNSKENRAIRQLKNADLNKGGDIYLVVECKNIGEKGYAFGEIRFKIKGMNVTIPVSCLSMSGNMKSFVNCAVVNLGGLAVADNEETPSITYYWENLYTY